MRQAAIFVLVVAWALLVCGSSRAESAYKPGARVPAGYHVESRVRMGPLVTGAVLGVLGYSVGVFGTASRGCSADRWLLLPVAGPFVSLAVAPDPRTSGPCEDPEDVHYAIRMLSGIGQGAGGFLIFIAVADQRKYLVADEVTVAVIPSLGPSSAGLAMIGTF